MGGRQKCGWAVCEEVDGVDVCLPAVEETDNDWISEDDLDVAAARLVRPASSAGSRQLAEE